jgi:ATP synthase F1 gamma subunit
MQLSELKKEMRFNNELLSLIDTLKSINSSKYHALEREKERFEDFMVEFGGFFNVVDLVHTDDPLVRPMSDVLGIVVVTSDSGFMGGLNAGVLRGVEEVQGSLSNKKVELIVIGEKGAGRLGDAGRKYAFFKGIDQETLYEQALEMTDYIVKEVLEERIGRVVLVYPKPLSISNQVIETIHVLPCADLFDKAKHKSRRRIADEEANANEKKGMLRRAVESALDVVVESSFSDLVEYLARTWVVSKLYEVFEDSKLSEFGARTIHLEGSHQKLEKEQKKLKYKFFRASHEQIDKGMRESYSATNIRKKRKKSEAKSAAARARVEQLPVLIGRKSANDRTSHG